MRVRLQRRSQTEIEEGEPEGEERNYPMMAEVSVRIAEVSIRIAEVLRREDMRRHARTCEDMRRHAKTRKDMQRHAKDMQRHGKTCKDLQRCTYV